VRKAFEVDAVRQLDRQQEFRFRVVSPKHVDIDVVAADTGHFFVVSDLEAKRLQGINRLLIEFKSVHVFLSCSRPPLGTRRC
jgi:hypothetical protein